MSRWKGLRQLVSAAVDAGSVGVERVQLDLAQRTFVVLEALPGIAAPARLVHGVHDLSVRSTHAAIRLVNRGVGAALDAVIDAREAGGAPRPPGGAPPD